jgi:FHS family Na+ dependent glucose MFS transporter 1
MPANRHRIAQTAAYYGGYIVIGLFAASLGPTLPGLARHTASQLSDISLLFMARSFGYLLGSLVCGRLYDRLPGHPLMAGVLGLTALMFFLAPLMSQLWLLTVVMLALGVNIGTLDVGVNTSLIWVHRGNSGPYMTGGHFFFGIGGLLAPIITAYLSLLSGDINWPYWALTLIVLPLVAWVLWLPSPARQVEVDASDPPGSRANPILVVLVTLFLFLYVGIEASFGGWIFTYAETLGMGSETTLAYLNAAFWVAFTVSCLIATLLAMRFRPRYILFGDLLLCLVSLTIILVWPASPMALWVGTVGAGLAIASVFPTAVALAERRMPITSTVTSWFFVGAGAGGMLLPWLIGQLFGSIGPLVAMYGMLADVLLALAVLAVLVRFEPFTPRTASSARRPMC